MGRGNDILGVVRNLYSRGVDISVCMESRLQEKWRETNYNNVCGIQCYLAFNVSLLYSLGPFSLIRHMV